MIDIKDLENKIINYKTIQVDKKQVRIHRFLMEKMQEKNQCARFAEIQQDM